ncbi:SDR family NAD(P)-dependent oxidoreductase [Paraburkholderia tropica]|uniref:SDR family NAD(P)-dependent oxidoreductase n=1 Tax=Paraburkholderia tropica TaxID=92647 RepID=UPI002ABDEB21|nr:SDR family NAD(P)-dependent oxidoreductase [Paraburkholderia tropica]
MEQSRNEGAEVAIVTGAGNGIGAATVRRLVARGLKVVAVDLDEAAVNMLSREIGASCLPLCSDAATEAGARRYVDTALEHFGRIDYLHCNAGIEGRAVALEESEPAQFHRVIEVNVGSVYHGMRAVLPHLYAQGHGAIVNMASQAGLRGVPKLAAYVASKHAVVGLTRCAALEAGPRGVRVNAVAPGQIATRMIESLEAQWSPGNAAAVHAQLVALIPLGRYGQPSEIANLVSWLLSDEAAFVNGAIYTADGGTTA